MSQIKILILSIHFAKKKKKKLPRNFFLTSSSYKNKLSLKNLFCLCLMRIVLQKNKKLLRRIFMQKVKVEKVLVVSVLKDKQKISHC